MTADDNKIMRLQLKTFGGANYIQKEVLYSAVDHDLISKHTWRYHEEGYARNNEDDWFMHHYIMGKPPPGYVIDHIDHDGLNNTRENLRIATKPQNSQNKIKKSGVTSNYIGVSMGKSAKKWVCWSTYIYLGSFDDPIEAAKKYDTYVLLKYGKDAQTNGFINYDDIKDVDIETLRCHRPERELPPYIYDHDRNGFQVKITYNGKDYCRNAKTINEGIIRRDEILKEIDEIKKKEIEDHNNLEIVRNDKGDAIINATGGIIIVDDDKWHECMKYKWYKSEGTYKTNIPGVRGEKLRLHRFIMNAQSGDKVTFVDNKNKDDFRVKNLQFSSSSQISHQANKTMKIENKTSIFTGVSFDKNSQRWRVNITKDKIPYDLGLFELELEAANAYREKENELYGLQPKKKIIKKEKEVIIEEQNEDEEVIVLKKKKVIKNSLKNK